MNEKMTVRKKSIARVQGMGLPVNINLPLLDDFSGVKNKDSVINRALCIYAILAVSFGFERNKCKSWLVQEKLISYLTDSENELLTKVVDQNIVKISVESLWSLAWSMNLIGSVNHEDFCGDELSGLFPKISKNESTTIFRRNIKLRSYEEIWIEADLAYCIHWGMRENLLNRKSNKLPIYVIEERRRALDWILFGDEWQEVSLDT